jgi:mannosylglycerate hydrolase
VYTGSCKNEVSYAGTQYTYITRETDPKALKTWKQDGWFEEPSPTNPILNHVSMVSDKYVTTAFTRSCKEYELIGEGKKDLAITLFRSFGAMGLPDLNRRPGRPSGLDYMIFESPEAQLIGENKFELGLAYYENYNSNVIMNNYIVYACDPCYYQNQAYEKTVFPLSYFPTNPLPFKIPERYNFLTLEGSEVSFGTIVKSIKDNGYALRIYNNENCEVEGGLLRAGFDYKKIYKTNLMESELSETSRKLDIFRKGELRTIKFVK